MNRNREERTKKEYYPTIYWKPFKIHCFNLAPQLYPFPGLATCVSAAGMPAYTETQMYLQPLLTAATVHMMQQLLTAATVHYVIEFYQTSFAFNSTQCII